MPVPSRRSFLLWSSALLAAPALADNRTGRRIAVADFALDPANPAPAIARAIAQLPRTGGAELYFAPGIYRFPESSGPAIALRDLADITLRADGAVFLFEGGAQPIAADRCRNLVLRGFTIDWDRPPFSHGDVLAYDPVGLTFDLRIDPQFPVDGTERFFAWATYERASGQMARNGLDVYGNIRSVRLVDRQTLRIALERRVPLAAGQTVLLRHTHRNTHAITLHGCADVAISDVTIHAAVSIGVFAGRCRNLHIDHLMVVPRPKSGRLMSTCADATHFADCEGEIHIEHCAMAGMGDDCVNILSLYQRITRVVDARTLEVTNRVGSPFGPEDVLPAGHTVSLSRGHTLATYAMLTVRQAEAGPRSRVHVNDDLPADIRPGDVLFDESEGLHSHIHDCSFYGNRARGILAHGNLTVEHCHFSNQWNAAIFLSPDLYWLEGGVASQVRIRNNHFEQVGRMNGHQPSILIDARASDDGTRDFSSSETVNHDIEISGNEFVDPSGPAIEAHAVAGLTITDNHFQRPQPVAIVLNTVARVQLAGNQSDQPALVSTCGVADQALQTGANGNLLARCAP